MTTIAAICAIGIAFSPTSTSGANSRSIHVSNEIGPDWFGIPKHFIFAGLFFVAVAIICLRYFPKTDSHNKTKDGKKTQKSKRNRTYRICGWTIIACLVVLGLYFILEPAFVQNFPVVFVFESIAIWAFGISWLTKGETLYPDGEHYIKKAVREARNTLVNKPTIQSIQGQRVTEKETA